MTVPRTGKEEGVKISKPAKKTSAQESTPVQAELSEQPPVQMNAAAASDVEEFIARARALGLTLTKEDYERARAGVSAFLRAKRVTQGATANAVEEKLGECSSSRQSADISTPVAEEGIRKRNVSTSEAPSHIVTSLSKTASQSKLSSAFSSLSFLTAVELDQEPKGKSRPRLDDISNLEERRRRRERRRRLRERAEREGNDADCETGSHRCRKAASESCLESPVTCIGAEDTPNLSVVSKVSPYTEDGCMRRSGKSKDAVAFSAGALARLGLGIRDCDEKTGGGVQTPSKMSTDLLLEAWQQSTLQGSPGLSLLSRKARIDLAGRLTLMASPCKEPDAMLEDPLQQSCVAVHEEQEAMNGDTDDSGVCFPISEGQASATKKPDYIPSHRRRLSSLDSSNAGGAQNPTDQMSLLDRIMAQKKSPLRLRREAKERERQMSIAAQNDLIVMTARTVAPMPSRSTQLDSEVSASLLQPSAMTNTSIPAAHSNEPSKLVRWASDPAASRMRMTTKEIYDFEFYGIAPTTIQNGASAFPPWDAAEMDELSRRAGQDQNEHGQGNHMRMRSNFNNVSFGSPVATRSGNLSYEKGAPYSPGMLSLSLSDQNGQTSNGNTLASLGSQLSAKRGLLFGGIQTPPVPSTLPLDSAMLDLTNVFSHGPTLAQSPARKGQVDTETPPRLVRATTLAAPIALAYGRNDADTKTGSPERTSLLRAHSYSSVERRGLLSGRDRVDKNDDDKENQAPSSDAVHSSSGGGGSRRLPKGWAHRSPAGKVSATISPAALFGFPQAQQLHQQQQYHQQQKAIPFEGKVERQTKQQRARLSSSGSAPSNQFSASEAEGDDERDMSPITIMQGNKAGNGMAAKRRKEAAATASRNHQRNSSASTSSAYDDSPLMLDTRNNKATVVLRPTSATSLAQALDMPDRHGNARSAEEAGNGKRKKKADTSGNRGAGQSVQAGNTSTDRVAQSGTAGTNTGMHQSLEWDKADGSRIVKLVSEELQAAIESGALTVEPASRFYKLPPGWGRSKDKPQSASYAGMIGQAILSSSDGRLSLNEIYNWIATVFPFFERGDRGWQNSIRHNLSLNKSFVKVERDSSIPGKGGWWAIKAGHEDRFRNGSYVAPGAVKASKEPSQQQQLKKASVNQSENSSARTDSTRKRPNSEGVANTDAGSDSDSLSANGGKLNSERKRKKGKAGASETEKPHDGSMKPMPVTLLRPEGVSMSPKPFGMKTPIRADQLTRHGMGTNSSEFGSAYASSIMATLPLLTDASSPPSSPHNGMPPPAGGVRGAASSQSAQKQAQSTLALNSFFGHGHSTYGYNLPGNFSHHAMPASPLANVRGGGGTVSSLNGRNSISLTVPSPESPLRQSNERSSMMVNSPPVSNVRDSDESREKQNSASHDKQTSGMNKSTAKSPANYLQHSPIRGSPLRPGGAVHQNGTMLSPASSHLQMVLGNGVASLGPSSSQQSLSAASLTTASSYGATTPLTARWGYASPSPSRRLDGLFSPAHLAFANTPNGQAGHGMSTSGLDDPFDYSASFQHEFDLTNDLQFHGNDPSPMKGVEQHAFGQRGSAFMPMGGGASVGINMLGSHFHTQQTNSPSSQYNQTF